MNKIIPLSTVLFLAFSSHSFAQQDNRVNLTNPPAPNANSNLEAVESTVNRQLSAIEQGTEQIQRAEERQEQRQEMRNEIRNEMNNRNNANAPTPNVYPNTPAPHVDNRAASVHPNAVNPNNANRMVNDPTAMNAMVNPGTNSTVGNPNFNNTRVPPNTDNTVGSPVVTPNMNPAAPNTGVNNDSIHPNTNNHISDRYMESPNSSNINDRADRGKVSQGVTSSRDNVNNNNLQRPAGAQTTPEGQSTVPSEQQNHAQSVPITPATKPV